MNRMNRPVVASRDRNAVAWNEGRSIHVGINRVDEAAYAGRLPRLRSSEADARSMREVADRMGFASRLLLGEEATREKVFDCLAATIERLVADDVLMISYAGHMTRLSGLGCRPGGWDEAWCLYDGTILDDEFHELLARVPAGVDVVVVTDSCFAAGMVYGQDAEPRAIALLSASGRDESSGTDRPAPGPSYAAGDARPGVGREAKSIFDIAGVDLVARAPRPGTSASAIARLVRRDGVSGGKARAVSDRAEIVARVVSLASAAEGSLAFEGEKHGLFTAALLETLDRSDGADLTYRALMKSVTALLPCQTPAFGVFGAADASAEDAPAFGLATAEPAARDARQPTFGEIRAAAKKRPRS